MRKAAAEVLGKGWKEARSSNLLAELKACSSTRNLERGRRLHAEAVERGSICNMYVASALVNMYAKCGSMAGARQVFESMKQPDVVTWNALIFGYADNGEGTVALDLFARMRSQGCAPSSLSFVAALKACTALALKQDENGKAECRERGREIHLLASEAGCGSEMYVQNTSIGMYANCGSMLDAQRVFDSMKRPSLVSWNALILGYAENGDGDTALDCFSRLRCQGHSPDSRTVVAALKACALLALKQEGSRREECRERGRRIHLLASDVGCDSDIFVQNTLIDMYSKCGSMVDAQRVFDSIEHPNVVSWNALILGYAEAGEGITALDLFSRMRSQGCRPDPRTIVAALKACNTVASKQEGTVSAECSEWGRRIHSLSTEIGCDSDLFVQSSLIDLYAKCGNMVDAFTIFGRMKTPDVVCWNSLIFGYVDNGDGVTALDLFTRMRSQGYAPNCLTFVAALKACSLLGALEAGKIIHAEVVASGTNIGVVLVTSLVDFYAKCGSLVEAQKVFESHSRTRDLTTWTALLAGYSRLGDSKAVFELFQGMQDAGFQPNSVTFMCILTCCSHAGLVAKGKECFDAMSLKYGVAPTVDHYSCMIDIFGRSNQLDDAMELLQGMPCSPNVVTWMTLLGACRKWKNVEIGRLAFKSLVSFDDPNATSAAYVLMAHIYKCKGMWEEQEMLLAMRGKCAAWKKPGQSWWTNEFGQVHTFLVGDKEPQPHQIHQKLKLTPNY